MPPRLTQAVRTRPQRRGQKGPAQARRGEARHTGRAHGHGAKAPGDHAVVFGFGSGCSPSGQVSYKLPKQIQGFFPAGMAVDMRSMPYLLPDARSWANYRINVDLLVLLWDIAENFLIIRNGLGKQLPADISPGQKTTGQRPGHVVKHLDLCPSHVEKASRGKVPRDIQSGD